MCFTSDPFEHFLRIQGGEVKEGKNQTLVGRTMEILPVEPAIETNVARSMAAVIPNAHRSSELIAAIVPWLCEACESDESYIAYMRDLGQFFHAMAAKGIGPLRITADHIRIYKASMLAKGGKKATVSRKLSVLRRAYNRLAQKGLIDWAEAQDIQSIEAPPVEKNSTPALTRAQAISLLEAIPAGTLKGVRDLALLQTYFSTGCRASAIVGARVGDIEFDGVDHRLHVTEKRGKQSRKLLLDAARPVFAYVAAAGIKAEREGPLFRPLTKRLDEFENAFLHRTTPWRLVKQYCRLAGINPAGLHRRGIGVHSLRKTSITEAIRNGAGMHEVREFAGHSDIRTTELYYVRREEDAEFAARRVQIRATAK